MPNPMLSASVQPNKDHTIVHGKSITILLHVCGHKAHSPAVDNFSMESVSSV